MTGYIDLKVSIIGLMIGFLVGLTGIGGGVLMTPLLIFVVGMRPILAVGTDLVYAAITKIFGAWQHFRQGTVDLGVACYLALGSVPATLGGVRLLSFIEQSHGETIDLFVSKALGITLLLVSSVLILRSFNGYNGRRTNSITANLRLTKKRRMLTILLGVVVGFLVGLTSVGSGTLIVALLVLFYPMSPSKVVGTDIFHAAILISAAALAHTLNGNIQMPVVGSLLVGSIPGVLLGGKVHIKVPQRMLRLLLAILLLFSAIKLLIGTHS